MQREIRNTWYFNRSPQEVWEYLTRPELLEQWLMKNDFKPVVGHKFRFICDTITHCEVLEMRPYTLLSYTWQGESATDGKPFTSKVEWTLTPKVNGTELQLVHNGFMTQYDLTGHEAAWTALINKFAERLNSFTIEIEVSQSPEAVFECLKNVGKWWGKEDFAGNSTQLNDEFTITHGDVHYSRQKLTDVIPGKKIVWLVTESRLTWIADKNEWTNTRMIFELIPEGGNTIIRFTHDGLTPEKECYSDCSQGWNMVIGDWLKNFISEERTHF